MWKLKKVDVPKPNDTSVKSSKAPISETVCTTPVVVREKTCLHKRILTRMRNIDHGEPRIYSPRAMSLNPL